MRGAGSPAQTDTPALHTRASFPSPPSATSSSPCHCFADVSTLSKTTQRSPRPTPTLSGIGDRRLACSVPRVQPALSCRCPSRSKRPRHVGPHKDPHHLASQDSLSSREGSRGRGEAREGNFWGWGPRSTRGLLRDRPGCVRGGGAAGARAHVHPPGRARRGHETRSLGLELQGASEDSAERPTALLPRPSRQPNSASARAKRNSRDPLPGAPGRPRCALRSPPQDPCGPPLPSAAPKKPPTTPGGGSPSPLPWLRARPRWGRGHPSLRAPLAAPDPGGAEPRNKPKVTDLPLQRAPALPTAAAAAGASRGGPGAPATRSARRARRAAGPAREGSAASAPAAWAPGAALPEAPHLPAALGAPGRTPPPGARLRAGAFCVTAQTQAPRGGGGGLRSPRHRPSPAAPPPPTPAPPPPHPPTAAGPGRPSVSPESHPRRPREELPHPGPRAP
ncbi:basic proline-rich protein-like [Meles meles]|uniref:basic proline-rich protein-like n=1 Tax=Meles meles TaxID=9662 RepID=UPI001E69C040|nr:basic proline-rich protein-like [Meles meles]